MGPTHRLALATPLMVALALVGCGGSSGGGTRSASGPRVSLLAVAPADFSGSAEGFDASGEPVYALADPTGQTWGVYASKDRLLYSMSVAGPAFSTPKGITGKYVVGTSGQGLVVASLNADGSTSSTTFSGYSYVACASGKALVTSFSGASAGYSLIDLATGSVASEAIPAGSTFLAFKGRFVLCGGTSPVVFDTGSGASVALRAPAGTDGTVSALAVNASGQTLGATTAGGVQQIRLWDAAGAPGDVLDTTAPNETVAFGSLSGDGSRMVYKKIGGNYEHQFIRSGGVSYNMTPGSPYSTIADMSDDGTTAFAADLSANEARVTVSIAYP